jgi:hypothetical protein
MREFEVNLPCELSAADFWALRSDTAFDDFFTRCDGQTYKLLKNEVSATSIGREYKLVANENPLPKVLQGALPSMDELCFRVQCSFHPTKYDASSPYRYTTFFPVLTDRIQVSGEQFCLDTGPCSCELVARVRLNVVCPPPISWTAEKFIETQIRAAYTNLPLRAKAYHDQHKTLSARRPMPPLAAAGVHWDYGQDLPPPPPKLPAPAAPQPGTNGPTPSGASETRSVARPMPHADPVGEDSAPHAGSADLGGVSGFGSVPLPEALARCLVPELARKLHASETSSMATATLRMQVAALQAEVTALRDRAVRAEDGLGAAQREVDLLTSQVHAHAHATCTCNMHMQHAHATCTCNMHMQHAHATCDMHMHMQTCACACTRCGSLFRPFALWMLARLGRSLFKLPS